MHSEEQLSEHFAELADAELLAQLRSGTLTALASDTICRELAARGVTIEEASAEPLQAEVPFSRASATGRRAMHFFLFRVLRFPVNAVRGSDPLWAVFIAGALIVFFVFRMSILVLGHLVFMQPVSPHVLLYSYASLAAYALAAIWFGIALWCTAGRARLLAWKMLARIFAVLIVLNCVLGSLGAARLIHDHFPPPPDDGPGVMDAVP